MPGTAEAEIVCPLMRNRPRNAHVVAAACAMAADLLPPGLDVIDLHQEVPTLPQAAPYMNCSTLMEGEVWCC